MKNWKTLLCLLSAVLLAPAAAAGNPRIGIGTPYELSADSAWLEGCIAGLCLCPIALHDDLSGDFTLVELPIVPPGPQRLFAILDLHWTLVRGDERIDIRGSGFYQTAAPVLDEQRLMLDLEFDGVPIEKLDSGVVDGGLSFPKIEIQALTPGECVQQGVQLAAAPVPEPSRALLQSAAFLAAGFLTRLRNGSRRERRSACP